jgi:hypothetical protein
MCFPKGYTGMSGKFHEGAFCIMNGGQGERVETPADMEDHRAFAHGGYDM